MAQFVTHIQPTLMEASHHHMPHHYKECHKDKCKDYHKDSMSHHKMHHDDAESHMKDAQKHQGHPRDFPVLPKDHPYGAHHDECDQIHKPDHGHHSKGHHNGQLRESRSHSEDSGLYIDSHGIPHAYQLHFIDAQGIYRDSEGHALDVECQQHKEVHHKKEKNGHHKEKDGHHKDKDVHRKGSTDLQPREGDDKSQHSHHYEKEGVSRPAPPQFIDLHPINLENKGSDGNTSFLRAARAGHLDKVLEHLKQNIDINTSNANGLNALHLASKDGHVQVVEELLRRGAFVDAATKKGNTALHIASLAGQEEVVKLLVQHGASVNVQSQNGFTPLYMAAQENHDNVVKYLLANGANQSLATEDGFTPLAVAMQQGHDKVVTVLLENDTRGKVRLPALHIAAKKDDVKAAKLLLENEHNPDVTSKSGFTPLHIASHYGNESIANLLIQKGADVNYAAKHNISPLHVAAKWGKTNMVALLLDKGANIESKTRDGLTPLHCAARSGHEQVVDMLLERGAPISSKTKNGLAPLHMAAQGDHVDAARILLYHRAPVDEVTVDYLTALHVAAHCGHARVAKLLLDRGADANARALNGFTPLHIACKKNRSKVVELLLKHGASIGATTESGLTPLHVASFMGCMNIVIYLLQHEANPDVPTVRGETPLHLAARANQTDIIRILLRNGANVDARAREQQTPLHIASRLGNVDIVMLLLQHGAKVDTTTKDMYTALHIAAKEGQDEVATALIDNGASLNATTKKGFTPLHLAAKYGNIKVAKLLLQKEAPVDAQGKNGVTPLHVASHYDHQNVALLLLDKGASPHATAKNGHTPLHIAARKNQMDIANTLLEYGAQPNAESKAGFTPLHLSSQEGHTDMSSLLIEHQADTNHPAKNGLTPLHLCAQEDRVPVAEILLKNGAEIDAQTKGGYTPLHVASHYGQSNMVKFLLANGANVKSTTSIGYTPLHQAAQQGHTNIVNVLLENSAQPNAVTMNGQTPLSIAQKLGYISVIETLKVVTETTVTTTTVTTTEEKYRVVAPEAMQETFMSDSEEEGGEDTLLGDQTYRYLTADEMKSLGDDSLPIDVTKDERMDSNRMVTSGDSNILPPQAIEDSISPQHIQQNYIEYARKYAPDNVDIARHPISIGKLHWKNFLVSFLVDARGGAMRGCRHSGVRVIVPPRCAPSPTRITCRYVRPQRTPHPPPLMEGEALASRILELGPVGVKFLGPVIIEVPHFAALRGKEREIVILRSDNGETWREHTVDSSEEILNDVLHDSFEADELNQLEDPASGRITRIVTNDFPQYFSVVSRVRQEVHAIGPEGGMVSSTVVPQVQAVFPQGALTKKIKVGLQAQPIDPEITAKLLGHGVAVSPVVTVEPRRRKFHKAITLSMPAPRAHSQGMINQYSGSAPTLRLLCSITGGTTRAQWEDVTGSTPLTFVNDCVSFTTTVSARFWLMDCRNIGDATKMATELYKEAIHVPFMAKFVVFAKRVDPLEARLRVFCMTDDKEDKTLEHQEHFTEVAKSRDVEVLEGKPQYIEFAGNLVPVTKSGEQLQFSFRAFRENRLPFSVRVKDQHAEAVGRCLFMKEAKVPKGEPPQQPICILNIVLPDDIIYETISLTDSESWKRPGFLKDSYEYYRPDPRLADMSNLLGEDWVPLANQLGLTTSEINVIKSEYPDSVAKQAQSMLRMWIAQSGNRAQGNVLENALIRVGREDIIPQCLNVEPVEHVHKREEISRVSKDYYDKDRFIDAEDHVETRERYEDKYSAEEKIVDEISDEEENFKKTVSERRNLIEKRLSAERAIPASSQRVEIVQEISTIKRQSLVEDKIAEVEEKQKTLQEPTKTTTTKTTTSPDGRTVTETVETKTTKPLDAQQLQMDQYFAAQPDITTVTTTITEVRTTEFIPDTELPTHKVEVSGDRRDSDLLEGVTQRLETTKKSVPKISAEDPNSPKFSKTPPPSPADFIIREQAAAVQEWDASGKPSVEGPVARGTPAVDAVQKDASYGLTQTSAELTTSESHLTTAIPKPKPRVTKSTDADIPRDSQKSPVRDDVLDTDLSQDITTTIEEESKTYTDKKKFWETISSDSESKVTKRMSLHEELSLEKLTVAKKRTSLHEVPPVPKPRSAVQPSETVEETPIKKDQRVSFDSTASDSSGLHHTEVTKISGSDASFDEVPIKVMSEYQAQFQDPAALPKSILKATDTDIRIDTQARDSFDSEKGYGAQEQGYISDSEDVEHYISDSEIEDRVPQIRTRQMSVFQPAVPARKSIYERSFSLPTEDLYDISASMRLRKQYFEEQLRKEMVEEQLTTELEEETSPEHKTLSSLQVLEEEPAGTRSAPEEVDENKFDSTVKSVKDLARAFDSSPKISEEKKKPKSVKELAKGFETETGSVIIRQKMKSPKAKYDEEDDRTKSFQDIKTIFDTTEIHKQEVTTPDELYRITHKPETKKTHKEDKQKLAEEYAERFMMEQKEFSRETQKRAHGFEVTTSETSYSREDTHKPDMKTAFGDEPVDDIKATPESTIMEQETHKPDATLTHKPESHVAVPPKDFQTHKGAQLESQTKRSSTESEKSSSPERSLEFVDGISSHEVILTKDDSISRPSDSMEVHVDKSEVEDSEKITDNEQDATDIETKSLDSLNAVEVVSKIPFSADDQIPEITVTLSGKQRRISETSDESLDEGHQDIRAISPIAEKPEITSPVHQPEVHVEDTVWEVSVQSQPSFEKTIDLPTEKEIKVERDEELSGSARDESELGSEIHQDHSESLASDRAKSESHSEIEQIILESLQHQNISPDEARKIAAELVEDIETEIHKRQQHMGTGSDEPCVPTPELARNQVSEYLRQLAEAKGLDSREVELVESVLARKQRFAKLKRDDTQASSMEITDEDLKFSGTETDYSPSASQAHILEQLEAEKMDIEGVFDTMKREYEDRLSTTDKVDEHHTDETSISKSSTTYEEGKLIGIKSDIHTKTMEGVKSGKSKKDTIVEEDEGTTEVTTQKSEFKGIKKETLVKQTDEKIADDFSIKKESTGVTLEQDDHKLDTITKISDAITDSGKVEKTLTKKTEEDTTKVLGKYETEVKSHEIGDSTKTDTCEKEKHLTEGIVKKEMESTHDDIKQSTFTTDGSKLETSEVIDKSHTKISSSSVLVDEVHTESIITKSELIDDLNPEDIQTLIKDKEITITTHEEVKRTLSDESKSSQDESIKSPEDQFSTCSSGRKGDSDTVSKTAEKHDVILRKTKTHKDADTSSSSGNLKPDRKSGVDFEAYSSSGESHYHSFELDSGKSRPCSSDVEGLLAAGSSEYESALTSQDISGRSHLISEYHTAASSLSSKESMKSLDSESSGNLASVEISEVSETLVASELEFQGDEDEVARDDGIWPERPTRQGTQLSDSDYPDIEGSMDVSEDEFSNEPKPIEEIPSKMKRSHEMTFQPEPKVLVAESPQSETCQEGDEKFGSVDEGSVLSMSLSSTSSVAALRTVIELSRADSERQEGSMNISVTSEQLSLDDMENLPRGSRESLVGSHLLQFDASTPTPTATTDSATCTHPPVLDLPVGSVTITSSIIAENGIQSVSTQVTSRSHTPTSQEEFDITQPNGPTEVDYVPEYDDVVEPKKKGHRRHESTSSFVPPPVSIPSTTTRTELERKLHSDLAESDKYTTELSFKEVRSDEKKDIDETEREESYETEADQGFHRDMRESRFLDTESDQDNDLETKDLSRPHSQVSKTDSELVELAKQSSSEAVTDPIERPVSPEPCDECEIKDDTPEFSSEAQASVGELEQEYSSAVARTHEVHVTDIKKVSSKEDKPPHKDILEKRDSHGRISGSSSEKSSFEEAEAEAAFSMVAHISPAHKVKQICPILEDEDAEKHELETRERAQKELEERRAQMRDVSPSAIPDIKVTQHMTPLIDRGFHYPDLELEEQEAETQKSTPETPASNSSKTSEETDQGKEYVLDDGGVSIPEEPESGVLDEKSEKALTESKSEVVSVVEKTIRETGKEAESPTESPNSDSFEMLEKPDLMDDFVIIEEVAKEAFEQDTEGKSVRISSGKKPGKKHDEEVEEYLIKSSTSPKTKMTELKYYPDGSSSDELGFEFEDSPPTANQKNAGVTAKEGSGSSPRDYVYEYDRELEANKKWIEQQFQGDQAILMAAGYGYEMEFERAPLEDIKEEEVTDFDPTSSRIGSLGSQKESGGSLGSVKDSFSSTPEYDVLAGRKYFTRSGEHDDVSMSSLQEFENLERAMSLENRRCHQGSQDSSSNGSFGKRYYASRSGQGDDVSVSSLKEFEGLEKACIAVHKIEQKVKEEEAMLAQIDEGQESIASESESCETMSGTDKKLIPDSDEEDYEKRMFEIDEIIRQAQSNVEKFIDIKEDDKPESIGRGDSLEEVSKVPDLDFDAPLPKPGSTKMQWATTDDIMATSTDSLDLKPDKPSRHDSTDSLDQKTTAADIMTASTDSIEFQTQQKSAKKTIMTDSIEFKDIPDQSYMMTSSDSLELATGTGAQAAALLSDSIDEDGSRIGFHDHSSSSTGKDFSSSVKEDQEQYDIREQLGFEGQDPLDVSSSTATHATCHYETDSVFSGSFTSGGSNTMVSSTDTIDPTGSHVREAVDLAAAVRKVWFDDDSEAAGKRFTTEYIDDSSKPYVTEVIEPCEGDDTYSHTIHRRVELPPEIHKVTFRGPDANQQLRQYIQEFGEGEDVQESEEVDADGNVHVKRVVQKRFVVKSEDKIDEQPSDPQHSQQIGQKSKEWEGQGVIKRTYTDGQGTKTIYTQQFGLKQMEGQDSTSAVHSLLSSIAGDTAGEGSGTWQAAPESVLPRPPAPFKAQASRRRPLRYEISVDDQIEVDPREHDWRFNLPQYAGREEGTSEGPAQGPSSQPSTQPRSVSDQHQLSEEMKQLLREMEEDSKK